MPTSGPIFINEICKCIKDWNPSTVLDAGAGFGKFGVLTREYTDIWQDRYERSKWKTKIDAVEIFAVYYNENYNVYDNVFINDILDILPTIQNKYDLILCIDVLEHFEKEKGMKLLELMRIKGKRSIVVLPIHPTRQGIVNDNVYETHRSKWKESELKEWGSVASKENAYMLIIGG